MKIWTRIGVLRITSTYTAASWLTTGIRCARAAPSVRPMIDAPAIAMAETVSVRRRASTSSSRLSRANDQTSPRNDGSSRPTITGAGSEERPRERPLFSRGTTRPLRALRRRVAMGVAEVVVRPEDVLLEGREHPRGDVVLQDRVEGVALLHDCEP